MEIKTLTTLEELESLGSALTMEGLEKIQYLNLLIGQNSIHQ